MKTMGFFSFLGVLSPAHISLFTTFSRGKKVGTDTLGNVYYEAQPRRGYKLSRRWVMYKDTPEPSSIPPEWHGWIHHQTDVVPNENTPSYRRDWQKPPIANMTGTTAAYLPDGHLLGKGKRARATGDYEAWTPSD